MKKIFLISSALLSLAIVSCNSTNSTGKFEVSGKIKGQKSGKIVLRELDFASNSPVPVDSQKINTDGTYTLKSKIGGQHLFTLSIDDGFPFLLINDNGKINFDINPLEPRSPVISGSDATTKLYGFINEYHDKYAALVNAFGALDSLNKLPTTTNADDSLIGVLSQQKKSLIEDMNASIKTFAENSANAVSVFYVLNVMAPNTEEPKDLLPVAQAASARFKEDGALAAFASRVKEAATNESDVNRNFNLLNQPAPDLAMQTPDGKPMKISDFKGKYLLVDFWASWCGPCRAENPNVVKAYNKYKDKNFTILGISLDKDKDSWVKAIKDDKLAWNHMSDLKEWESAAVQTYHFDGIPFNVLIDPSGKIIAANLRGDDLENKLAEVLK
ncbi:MAG TPA: TlpA disulfide reductase family protein [Arachidicoccus sp.]